MTAVVTERELGKPRPKKELTILLMRNNEGRYEKSSYESRKKQEAVYNERFEISPFLLDEIPGGSCSCQLKRFPSPDGTRSEPVLNPE